MKNTRFTKTISFLVILFLLPACLWAVDFGLVANVFSGYGNTESVDEATFEFKADLWPRLSFLIGDNGEFFMSAGISFADSEPALVPALLRTDFTMRFGNSGIRAGRMNYSDPLSFIASGLFDGIQLFSNSPSGRFSAGVWYTGFLYKNTAEITMTEDDQESFVVPLDLNDFNTYFAPKRMFTALEWSHPSLGEMLSINVTAIGQIDFTGAAYNNMYLLAKAGKPVNNFIFEFGGGLEIVMESSESEKPVKLAFAGDAGLSWILPTNIFSRLSLTGKIASWQMENDISEFTPITTVYYGEILKHKMSGLTVLSLNYSARLNEAFGTSLTASCFYRYDEDSEELRGPGTEITGRLIWSPLSDLQLNLGGGAYLPALSNTGTSDKSRWFVGLSAILSIF